MNLPNVLMIDDDPRFCLAMSKALRRRGFEVEVFNESESAIDALSEASRDSVAVLDLRMPMYSGLDILKLTPNRRLPVLMLTGHGAVPEAVEAMRAGAYTFLTKPIDAGDLAPMIIQAHQESLSLERVAPLIGESAEALRIRSIIERHRDVDGLVLITGDTGTGKEVVARLLHEQSCHGSGPFIAVNMAAISDERFEEELFGTVERSSGHETSREGLFDEAKGGTLFLDEIGELSMTQQAKLLRVLEHGQYRPVGGTKLKTFEGRLVAATHRSLREEVQEGRFRPDLYHRLTIFPFHLKPLSEREDDAIMILKYWFHRLTGKQMTLLPEGIEWMRKYTWSGNAREVVNLARRLCVYLEQNDDLKHSVSASLLEANLTRLQQKSAPTLSLDMLNEKREPKTREEEQRALIVEESACVPQAKDELIGQDVTLEELERVHILSLLRRYGNLSHVARILNVNRRTLQRKLKQWGEEL